MGEARHGRRRSNRRANQRTLQEPRKTGASCSFRGVFGARGCAVASEHDYQRLQQQLKIYFKIYYTISFVLLGGTIALQWWLVALVIAALFIVIYLVWMRYLLRNMQPSEERLSLHEALHKSHEIMISQAGARSAIGLWLQELGALVIVIFGILIIIFIPDDWPFGLFLILVLGLLHGTFCVHDRPPVAHNDYASLISLGFLLAQYVLQIGWPQA